MQTRHEISSNGIFYHSKKTLFLAILVVLLQVLIFFPISMWVQNQFNINVSFADGITVIVYMVLGITSVSLAIAIITPNRLIKYLLAFFVIFSVLVFLQQNVLVWNYGFLEGGELKFSDNSAKGWIDVGFWILGFILLLSRRKYLVKNATTILVFSGVASSILLLVNLSSYDFNKAKNTTSITDVDKFIFSKDKNIFLFILDGFQSDLFWEIIDKEPEIKNKLSGFTFYPDTAAVFAKTYPTIPLLLTGKMYQKKQPILDFINGAYKDSLLSQLIDTGWNVGLYPHIKNLILLDASVMDNYISKIRTIDKVDSYLQMLDLSLFRLVPHPIKKKVFNKGDFVIRKSLKQTITAMELFQETQISTKKPPKKTKHFGIDFLESLKNSATPNSNKPVFRYYHLLMPHVPFLLNRDLEYGNFNNKNAYKDYAYASLKLMISYLDELKKQGIYDNSAIIILADHGGGLYMQNKYDAKTGEYVSVPIDGKEKASSRPLLLIKNFSQQGMMAKSDNSISLTDIAPTIASFAGVDINSQNGMKIDNVSKNTQRDRIYYYFDFTGWDSKYLEDFITYKIKGNIYNDSSWFKTGVLVANEPEKTKVEKYILNKTISFGTDIKEGSAYHNSFLTGEDYKFSHSWVATTNQQINLLLNLEQPLLTGEIYKIEMRLSSNRKAINGRFELSGKKLSTLNLINKDKTYVTYFQASSELNQQDLHFKISLPIASENSKIKLIKFKLQKSRPKKIGAKAKLVFADDLQLHNPQGFGAKESWGRWSTKKQARLMFNVEQDFCQDGYMQLNINRFHTNVDSNNFQVFINEHKLSLIYAKAIGQRRVFYYDCSSYYLSPQKKSMINLIFETDKVVSPYEISNRGDKRKLGAAFTSLQFDKLSNMPVEQ